MFTHGVSGVPAADARQLVYQAVGTSWKRPSRRAQPHDRRRSCFSPILRVGAWRPRKSASSSSHSTRRGPITSDATSRVRPRRRLCVVWPARRCDSRLPGRPSHYVVGAHVDHDRSDSANTRCQQTIVRFQCCGSRVSVEINERIIILSPEVRELDLPGLGKSGCRMPLVNGKR